MAKTRFGSLDGIHKINKRTASQSTLISAGLFLIIIIAFLLIVSKISEGTIDEQRNVLMRAIDKGVLQCYVTEGRYPESFEYLRSHYGIIYDEDLFRVDYVIYGSNMKPDVTIIQLED